MVNVHHLADAVERHLASRKRPHIVISDERAELLGTGGGIAKALPQLGDAPFFLVNSDTVWLDGVKPNFARLAEAFDPATMDALLLAGADDRAASAMPAAATSPCCRTAACAGAASTRWCRSSMPAPRSSRPALFAEAPAGAFSLTPLFDRAGAKGRLFGLRLEGVWMHVGTPEAVAAAEAALAAAH